jgi:hypothetical protein
MPGEVHHRGLQAGEKDDKSAASPKKRAAKK